MFSGQWTRIRIDQTELSRTDVPEWILAFPGRAPTQDVEHQPVNPSVPAGGAQSLGTSKECWLTDSDG